MNDFEDFNENLLDSVDPLKNVKFLGFGYSVINMGDPEYEKYQNRYIISFNGSDTFYIFSEFISNVIRKAYRSGRFDGEMDLKNNIKTNIRNLKDLLNI